MCCGGESKIDKKKFGIITAVLLISTLLCFAVIYFFHPNILGLHGSADIDLSAKILKDTPVHMNIRVYQSGKLLLAQYHAGAITNLGKNITLAKLTGDSSYYNMTTYNLNTTYISIGNQGTLNTGSTVLPGEWNRTLGTVEDQDYDSFNLTCTFNPDASGPYTADCIGINFESGIGKDQSLFAYDTFSEVTGIDDSFTITVEFIVSIS